MHIQRQIYFATKYVQCARIHVVGNIRSEYTECQKVVR